MRLTDQGKLCVLLLVLAAALTPALAAQDTAADWPRFRGPGGLDAVRPFG